MEIVFHLAIPSNISKKKRLQMISNEIKHQYLSAEKARKKLDWRPLYTLDQGLQETIEWYKDFFAKS